MHIYIICSGQKICSALLAKGGGEASQCAQQLLRLFSPL